MKVKIAEDMKKIITIAEMPSVRKIQREFKDYDLRQEAEMAATIASGINGGFQILKLEAEICRNNRVMHYYGDESGNLDVWLKMYAFSSFDGFYVIGVCVSDLWSYVSGDKEILKHMYIRKFKEIDE